MPLPSHFTLNTGAKIPAIGLGTWQAPPGECAVAVEHALRAGYRHLDCAFVYGNESEVGQGIKASGVPRSEIFITSKVWLTYLDGRVEECLDKTLKMLGTDYLDLYLVHWPVRLVTAPGDEDNKFPTNPDGSRATDLAWDHSKSWAQLEDIYARTDKVKAIGISNWSVPYLEKLEKTWKVVPAVNQVENHPFLPQHKLKEWCESKGILLEAYSPLGSTNSPLLADPDLKKIADAHACHPAKILISYQIARGVVVLPKSVTPARIASNLETVDLTANELATLNGLAESKGKTQRVNTPLFGTDLGFDDWYNKAA